MYERETYDVILRRMLERVSDKLDKRESSLIWDTHSATAIELQILYIELDNLINNSYGDTAAREFLILLCKDRGISPYTATNAILEGRFVPETVDVAGQRFNIGALNYVVTEKISQGTYKLMCETPGEIGNRHLGQMIPMEYIEGLQTAELTGVLIPGEDEEDTEALRKRYLDSFDEQAFGGNRKAYFDAVRKINGVGDLKVTRVWNGDISPAEMIPNEAVTEWYTSIIDTLDEETALWLSKVYKAALEKKLTVGGTVSITVVDSDDYGEASKNLIESIQETLDPEQNAGEGYGLAPIGHVVNVKSAAAVQINVTTNVIFYDGYSWSMLEGLIKNAVEEYLLELRMAWSESGTTIVRIRQIESKILAVKGVADIDGTLLNGMAENLTLNAFEIPVMGGIEHD